MSSRLKFLETFRFVRHLCMTGAFRRPYRPSPFNVITKAMTISLFSEEEMRALYRQHTAETGQGFEEHAHQKAWDYSRGQPWLVNALARWCVEEIHKEDFSKPVTAADMDEAKEALIRERGTHLDSLMEKAYDPRIKPIIEQMLVGGEIDRDVQKEDLRYAIELGLFVDNGGTIIPANPIYRETIGRYLTRGTQDFILSKTKENVWVKDGKLDMPALMAAFQDFWRENATPESFVSQNFHEAYPHFVLQAFLQRVVNGGGQIGDWTRAARPRRHILQREVRRRDKDRRPLREVAGEGARADSEVHGRPRRLGWLARCGRRRRHEAMGRQDFHN